jgi:Family of unknown function (DUF6091)
MTAVPLVPTLRRLSAALSLSVCAAASQAASLCVFDLVGTQGDVFNMSRDFLIAMQRENIDLDVKIYTNEARAVEDYKAGRCDGVIATGLRTRPFNMMAGSIDTLGSTTIIRNGRIDVSASYEVLRKLVQTLAVDTPQVINLMSQARHEVGGILPIGAAYLMTNDKRINTIEALAGKRIAAMEYDPAQALMIKRVNAVPVPVDILTIAPKLRDKQVDVVAAPALGFKPLRLDQAVGENGAIARFPLMILTYQFIFDRTRFPEGFGVKARTYWLTQFDRVLQLIRKAERDIPDTLWMDLDPQDTYRYALMVQDARLDMTRQGIYDKRGMRILKKIRCHVNPSDGECKTKSEE